MLDTAIAGRIEEVRRRISGACRRAGRSSSEVKLIAVTKGIAAPAIREAFVAGIRDFGENRVQEAEAKFNALKDLRSQVNCHMIGHLQTNKAKTAIEVFDIIHSVDSVRLAEALNARSPRRLPVLIEVNVSGEAAKKGFAPAALREAVDRIKRCPRLEIIGLMTVAPIGTAEEVRPVFRKLRQLRDELGLKHLSMGMSDDFEVAIEEGATMIRIGRAIFGERDERAR